MSRLLSELLRAAEPQFHQTLQAFEQATGHPAADIRLAANIEQLVRNKAPELGLDPRDSNGREYYYSLQRLVARHDAFLAQALGLSHASHVEGALKAVQHGLKNLQFPKQTWAIKHSVARKLLKSHPPKKIMKQLGYRSVDSMLKRESVAELYVALRFVESADWQKRLVKSYKQLTPSDFESRPVEVLVLSHKKWGAQAYQQVLKARNNVLHSKELGAVALLPMPVLELPGICLTDFLLGLHYIDEIRTYSALFKLHQVRPDFGERLASAIQHDAHHTVSILDRPVHWRSVRKHFGREGGRHPHIFQPHVQPEDLLWLSAEYTLYHLEPALKFWEGNEYTGWLFDNRPVSFNLLDNAISYLNRLEYGQQSIFHFQRNLWNELLARYLTQDQIEQDVLRQLEGASSGHQSSPMLEEVFSV